MQHSSDIRRQRYGFCHLLFQCCKITVSLTAVVLGVASVRTVARVLWCTLFMFQLQITLFMYCIRIFKFN